MNAQDKRDRIRSWIYILPSLIGVMVFFVLPFTVIVFYSLIDNPATANFVGLENYIALFKNAAFIRAAKNTVRFSALAVTSAVVLSLLLAIALDAKIPGKSKFRTCFLSPLMVPTASVILIFQVIFSYNGTFNTFIAGLGLDPVDWMKSDYSQLVVCFLFLWKNIGYNMILFMSALSNVPREQLESAEVDGAGPWKRFFVIKLKYISASLFFVILMSIINSFKIFREVYLLTGGYPYDKIYFMQHFMNNVFQKFNYQKLSAAAVIMAIAIVIIIGVIFLLEDRFGRDVEE